MLVKSKEVLKELRILDSLYNKEKNVKVKAYYSKLSLLEICAWLEVVEDEILDQAISRLTDIKNVDESKTKKDRTHGFSYEKHLRPNIILYLGYYNLEKLESKMKVDLQTLKSKLGQLKSERDDAAHRPLYRNYLQYISPPIRFYNDVKTIIPILRKYAKMIK